MYGNVKNYGQILALQNLARVSKMDCWFQIDDDGYCHDGEDGGKMLSAKKAIYDLIDGMTDDDFSQLSEEDKISLIYVLHSLIK